MIKKKKKKFPFLNTDNNKKIDLNHKRKLSYRYRNGELQNTKNRYREKSLTEASRKYSRQTKPNRNRSTSLPKQEERS